MYFLRSGSQGASGLHRILYGANRHKFRAPELQDLSVEATFVSLWLPTILDTAKRSPSIQTWPLRVLSQLSRRISTLSTQTWL